MLLGMARFLSHSTNDLALRVIGLTSVIYVPFDIFDDTIARAGMPSDAYMLAAEFGGTTMLWGGLWLLLSFLVIAVSLRRILGSGSNISLPPRP